MSALIFDIDSLIVPAEDVRAGDTIRYADGRTRTVRDIVAGTVPAAPLVLVYTEGDHDTFRTSCPITLVDSSE